MILRFLFLAFVIYLAYRLVFHFIIPIYKTTRQVKKQFGEMKQRMQQNQPPNHQEQPNTADQNKKNPVGEYIDFEEVKE